MKTFDISDEEIINCIVDCANNMSGKEQTNTIKILIDFMRVKNIYEDNNIFKKGQNNGK